MPVLGLGVFQSAPGEPTRRAVRAALSAGYRLIDTARLYENEADVGQAIRESGVPRKEVFVTTKLWNTDHGFDRALAAFDRSLSALGSDYVDLYLIHWPSGGDRAESWRALRRILSEGRCRAIGVSNYTIAHLRELMQHSDVPPAVNQVEFSPFLYQRELLEFARGQGIQLEAYAPLTRARRISEPALSHISKAHGKTATQVMLRWSLQHGVIPIPKSVHPERIRENAELFDFVLTDEEMGAIDRLHDGFRTSWDPTGIP
ncbi:MAG: aldo/keto reductase [Thermoplasmata archaeon]|nr:aldo/keto reductase [Thermoplasmata archaeon]